MLPSISGEFSAGCIAAVLCAGATGSDTSRPVSDETLRLVALQGLFPQMQVSVDLGVKIDNSFTSDRAVRVAFT